MKKFILKALSLLLVVYTFSSPALARCCSRHGGIVGCNEYTGRYVCADGHLSKCRCARVYYYYDEDSYHAHHRHHHHYHDHYYY